VPKGLSCWQRPQKKRPVVWVFVGEPVETGDADPQKWWFYGKTMYKSMKHFLGANHQFFSLMELLYGDILGIY
jgi:hypothetical protein